MRQSTSEGAGHARITRRIRCHEAVENSGGIGVVAQLLLSLAGFEECHGREVVVRNVFGQLEQLRGGVLGGRRQAAVVACVHRLVTVRERVQIRVEVGAGAAEIPEQVANHARVEAVLGAHAAELLQQEHRIGRLARARELRNRGAERVDRVIRAAELARSDSQVVQLLAEEPLGARRGKQLAVGVHRRVGVAQGDLSGAELFGQVDLQQTRLSHFQAFLAISSGFVGTVGGQPHVLELEAHGGSDERIRVGDRAHLGGSVVVALESTQRLALEQPRGRDQVSAGRALEERLARCERLFELAVAHQGLAVDQAHFGLLVTFELLHERLDQTDCAGVVTGGQGVARVAHGAGLVGWQAGQGAHGQRRKTGRGRLRGGGRRRGGAGRSAGRRGGLIGRWLHGRVGLACSRRCGA